MAERGEADPALLQDAASRPTIVRPYTGEMRKLGHRCDQGTQILRRAETCRR